MYNSEEHYKRMLKMIDDESRRVNRIYYFAWFIFGLMFGVSVIVGVVRLING